MRPPPLPLVLAAAALAAVAGCSSGDSSTAGSAGSSAASSAKSSAKSSAHGTVPVAGQRGGAAPSASSSDVLLQREVVRTAGMLVEVDDVVPAAARAGADARALGGSVEQETVGVPGGGPASASLRLRVPGDRLDALLARISALGRERSREQVAEDVTDRTVDLDSRVLTQRRSVARMRALLDRAASVGEVVRVEGELTTREAGLESLLARRAAVRGLTVLATLSVELRGRTAAAAPHGDGGGGFAAGLAAGWGALTALGRVTARLAGALVPFLPLFLAAAATARRVRRRRSPPAVG